jgi:hypothetical protein
MRKLVLECATHSQSAVITVLHAMGESGNFYCHENHIRMRVGKQDVLASESELREFIAGTFELLQLNVRGQEVKVANVTQFLRDIRALAPGYLRDNSDLR